MSKSADAEIAALRRRNPQLGIVDTAPRPPIALTATEAAALGMTGDLGGAVPLEHDEQAATDKEKLARQFEYLWRMWQGPELTKEYRFHAHRKWRLDYYHAPTQTGIELHGGVWSKGRHTRGQGFLDDLDKMNAAQMQGIVVLQLGTGQVDHQHVTEIIDWIKSGVRA